MTPLAISAGVFMALWFGWLSCITRRWWPLFYFIALFVGIGAGIVLRAEDAPAAGWWWYLWAGYVVTLPTARAYLTYQRRRLEAEQDSMARLKALEAAMRREHPEWWEGPGGKR